MRKSLFLALLIVLGALPLQGSAQLSVPAVDLQCVNLLGEIQTNSVQQVDDGNNSTENETIDSVTEGPLAFIDSLGPVLTDTVNCTVANPNAYSERIQIQVSAAGLVVAAPGTIYLGPSEEASFNVTVRAGQMMSPSIRTLTITATVVEANGAPPPNIAEDQVIGDIYISKNYKEYGHNGCATMSSTYLPPEVANDWRYVTMEMQYTNNSGQQINDNFTIALNHTAAPLHSENFALLTWMGCYDDVIFHRVIEGFVIQGGDFEANSGSGGYTAKWYGYCNGQISNSTGVNYNSSSCAINQWSLPGEHTNGLRHATGSLAAAHAGLNTDGSQFYIVPTGSDPCWLDGDQDRNADGSGCVVVSNKDCSSKSCFTVYGTVTDGLEHIDAISKVNTQSDKPVHNVTIVSATLWNGTDSDGDGVNDNEDDFPNDVNETSDSDDDGVGDNEDDFPNDANETTDSDGDGTGDNSDAFPNDANETHDDDSDGVGNNSDAFPDDPDETHDDDGDGVGNNTDEFPQDPDEQFDNDGDGVGNNADDFPDNSLASNWVTIYSAVGLVMVLLIGAGIVVYRMKNEDELPNVQSSSELEQLEKQIDELQQKKNEMIGKEDASELMFNED